MLSKDRNNFTSFSRSYQETYNPNNHNLRAVLRIQQPVTITNALSSGINSEQLLSEAVLFETEGEGLERFVGERALALACYTKAASKSEF